MTVVLAANGEPVEIAPGRGDLRFSSYTLPRNLGSTTLVGGKSVSYADLFATQPWIGAAVMRMLTWAVRVPLKLYRRQDGGDSRIQVQQDQHPLARMIKRPWLGYDGGGPASQAALVQALLGPVLVHGNAVTELQVSGGDEWLIPLDWRYLTPIGTSSGASIDGWRYEQGTDKRDVALSKSLHCAWWSPLGPLGVSPLQQLGTTVGIEDAAQRYQRGLFQNGARPPSAIETSTEFLQMEKGDRRGLFDQLREDVDDIYMGPDRAGKPAILPPGLQWKEIGHNAVEAELIDQRKIAREEVAAVDQIPPPMMGILDKATYSNITTQREMAYTDCLGPPLVLIEQVLTATLARDYFGDDDLYLEFDFGPVLRGDRQKEIDAFRLAIAGTIYTPNEVRRALNQPPYEHPDADKLFLAGNNLAPLGEEAPSEQDRRLPQEAE